MKTTKIVYYISTALLTAMMIMSVGMYLFNNEKITEVFTNLGYPVYLIYPLAFAKVLGVLALWVEVSRSLKEWAYAGFFFDFMLALFAHLAIADGEFIGAAIALVFMFTSYITWKRLIIYKSLSN